MIRDRVIKLFKDYEQDVQQVIAEVLRIEQEYISMKTPRGVKEDIKEIVDRVVKEESDEQR